MDDPVKLDLSPVINLLHSATASTLATQSVQIPGYPEKLVADRLPTRGYGRAPEIAVNEATVSESAKADFNPLLGIGQLCAGCPQLSEERL